MKCQSLALLVDSLTRLEIPFAIVDDPGCLLSLKSSDNSRFCFFLRCPDRGATDFELAIRFVFAGPAMIPSSNMSFTLAVGLIPEGAEFTMSRIGVSLRTMFHWNGEDQSLKDGLDRWLQVAQDIRKCLFSRNVSSNEIARNNDTQSNISINDGESGISRILH